MCNLEQENPVWLQAECKYVAGALRMLSIIHSPEDVFTVLVSIFISKSHNHFSSDIQISLYWYIYMVRVIEFSASITRACTLWMIRTTYRRTDQPMPPALCLGIPVLRQKMAWITCNWVSHNSTYLHVCNYLVRGPTSESSAKFNMLGVFPSNMINSPKVQWSKTVNCAITILNDSSKQVF